MKITDLPAQLTLGIRLRDDATFENFTTGSNQSLLLALQALVREEGPLFIYLWGTPASGRSHLLQAACRAAKGRKKTAVYLPLIDLKSQSPLALVENLEKLFLIAIDDIHVIAQERPWEEALFHLYNRVYDSGACFVISGSVPPQQLSLSLPDLQSRLSASTVFRVHELTDEEKIIALQLRAHTRGLELPENVGSFLLHHCARNMEALLNVLETLDEASLAKQRKLTIPFVKQVLGI